MHAYNKNLTQKIDKNKVSSIDGENHRELVFQRRTNVSVNVQFVTSNTEEKKRIRKKQKYEKNEIKKKRAHTLNFFFFCISILFFSLASDRCVRLSLGWSVCVISDMKE